MPGYYQILSNSRWSTWIALCLLLGTLLVVAGTVVLALIPLYLTTKVTRNVSPNEVSYYAIYASDADNGRSRRLAELNSLSTQMMQSVSGWGKRMETKSARFLPGTESTRSKRQTTNSPIVCEQATDLRGDLFATLVKVRLPSTCHSLTCQQRSRENSQHALRLAHRRRQIDMRFADNTSQAVELAFCAFSDTDPYDRVAGIRDSLGCTPDTSKYIYLLDQDGKFFRFHPPTGAIALVGTLSCPTHAYPYSMAVQRNGRAWVLFTDGDLYTFDIQTLQCQTTSYVPEQEGLILFGMNFASDQSKNAETLYLSSDSSNPPYRLATLDTDTLEINVIGYYHSISARAELTGTNDGRLFGLFEGAPYVIAEINSTSAEILSRIAQNDIRYTSDSSNFAFASYSSNFFLFVGDQTFTDIFLYNATARTTARQTRIPHGIIGSAVSTCV